MGCPIRSSLNVAHLGTIANGMPVAMDEHAYKADAFVVVNRVKPHTEFTHSFESGLTRPLLFGFIEAVVDLMRAAPPGGDEIARSAPAQR